MISRNTGPNTISHLSNSVALGNYSANTVSTAVTRTSTLQWASVVDNNTQETDIVPKNICMILFALIAVFLTVQGQR